MIDLLGGRIQVFLGSVTGAQPQVAAGKARAIAVSSLQRSPQLPNVPTVHESGVPGFDMNPWFAMMAPASTPRDIILRLNSEMQRYLRSAEAAKAFNGQGADASPGTADELAALIKSDLAVWGKVIREHDIRGE